MQILYGREGGDGGQRRWAETAGGDSSRVGRLAETAPPPHPPRRVGRVCAHECGQGMHSCVCVRECGQYMHVCAWVWSIHACVCM